jgi:hypothetical protein
VGQITNSYTITRHYNKTSLYSGHPCAVSITVRHSRFSQEY